MKRIRCLLLAGICLLLGILETRASTTNYWVQNFNASLMGFVQFNGTVLNGTLPTKQLLTFLSSVTNLNNVLQTITNTTVTNTTVDVSNSPNFPPTNFPPEYVLTNNYGIAGSLTNNINFTNDIVFTEVTNDPVTYAFTNVIELTNGQTAYLFPNVQASSLIAVLSTNTTSSNLIFSLSGVVTNVSTTTIYAQYPDFTKQKGAKLIYVTPIVDLTNNLAGRYMVRYSIGKTVTNVDVSDCFSEGRNTAVSLALTTLTTTSYSLSEIRCDTTFPTSFFGQSFPRQAGTVVDMIGFDLQNRGIIFSKGKIVGGGVLKSRRLSGGGDGQVNGPIQSKTFNQATAVFNGSISFSIGHLESSL